MSWPAAKRTIITCERLISNEEIRRDPSETTIPYFLVDAVCEVPYGNYPVTWCMNTFRMKISAGVAKGRETLLLFKEFLQRNIYDCKDHHEYINKNGGMGKILKLRTIDICYIRRWTNETAI